MWMIQAFAKLGDHSHHLDIKVGLPFKKAELIRQWLFGYSYLTGFKPSQILSELVKKIIKKMPNRAHEVIVVGR